MEILHTCLLIHFTINKKYHLKLSSLILYGFLFLCFSQGKSISASNFKNIIKEYSIKENHFYNSSIYTDVIIDENKIETIPPEISIILPTNSSVVTKTGDELQIVAIASDVDGTINKVVFYLDGIPVSEDNTPQNGFSYIFKSYNVGDRTITASVTDNDNNKVYSDPLHITTILKDTSQSYSLISRKEVCSSSYTCVSLVALYNIDSVIGFDFDIRYDSEKLYPTGKFIISNNLIANPTWLSQRVNNIGDSIIHLTLYFNTSAGIDAHFSGIGELGCIEFIKTQKMNNIDQTMISCPVLSESYKKYTLDKIVSPAYVYNLQDTLFKASVTSWTNNKAILEVDGTSSDTYIIGKTKPWFQQKISENGIFEYSILNGEQISISRYIDKSFDLQPYLSGYDAYLLSRIVDQSYIYKPSVYELLAMDINRDGNISSGDLSQLQMRTVKRNDEFVQKTDSTRDWIFVPYSDVKFDPSFKISSIYPYDDGTGYSKFRVPKVLDLNYILFDNAINCPSIKTERFKAVLLGDVSGNYGLFSNDSIEKNDSIYLLFELTALDYFTSEIEITAHSDTIIRSVDLDFAIDDKFTLQEVTSLHETNDFYMYQNPNIIYSSFYRKPGNTQKVLKFKVISDSVLTLKDILFKYAIIDEKPVHTELKYINQINQYSPLHVDIYPNPTYDRFNIDVNASNVNIEIYSMLGYLINSFKNVNQHLECDFGFMPAGTYFIKVIVEDNVIVKKVIRKNKKQ